MDGPGENSDVHKTIRFEHLTVDTQGPENPHTKAVGDISGNGLVDIGVASSNGGPLVWYASPNWTKHIVAPAGSWSCDAKLMDVDGDGYLDILISEWYTRNRLEWYENPSPRGNPSTDPWRRHVIGSPRAHDIQVGDIDGDGQWEIVTRTQGADGDHILVWKRDVEKPDASTWNQRAIDCPPGEGLATGDIDDDGKLEVIIGGRWYDPPKDVLRGPWQEYPFADWPRDASACVTDLNSDGRLDVVPARSEGPHKISWFQVSPDPRSERWSEHVVDDSVDYAHSLAVGDIDNDGHLDIVTAEMHQSSRKGVLAYLNAGHAIEWRRQVVANTGSHKLCVGDVNGNGRLDLVGANWSGDYQPVEVWLDLGGRREKRSEFHELHRHPRALS